VFLLLSAPGACPGVIPFDALYISVSVSYNALDLRYAHRHLPIRG